MRHLSPDNAENRLLAAQLVDAHPLLFKDHHGEHHYLLGAPRNISRLLELQFDQPFPQFQSFSAPNKRTFKDMIGLEGKLEPVNHTPQFDQAISLTRWKKWADKKSYMELTDSICKFLNADWTQRRWLAHYCSRIFEGAILVNHAQCLLVNCTEIYPRLPCLDAHFERFKQVLPRHPFLKTTTPNTEMCKFVSWKTTTWTSLWYARYPSMLCSPQQFARMFIIFAPLERRATMDSLRPRQLEFISIKGL